MDKQYFVYDPENGIEYYETEDKMLRELQMAIDSYLDDDEWFDDPLQIVAGKITAKVIKSVIAKRSDQTIDAEGYDTNGRYWMDGDDQFIDYEIKKIE